MKIVRDKEKEAWLIERVREFLNKTPRTGTHVSDLLYPRKTYFQKTDPKPITEAQVGYFIAGRGHHEVIEAIVENKGKRRKGATDAGTFEWEGIYYSPDLRLPRPAEIKTSRAKYGPKNDEHDTLKEQYKLYLKQLFSYMAIENDSGGDLIVFYLNLKSKEVKKTVPQFRWYRVEMTPEEITKMRGNLLAAKVRLESAIANKDHTALPLCPPFMCIDCQWKKPCDPKNTSPKKEVAAE